MFESCILAPSSKIQFNFEQPLQENQIYENVNFNQFDVVFWELNFDFLSYFLSTWSAIYWKCLQKLHTLHFISGKD